MIRWKCACGRQLQAKDQFLGRRVKCPTCETSQVVPGEEAAIQQTPSRSASHARVSKSRPATLDRQQSDEEPSHPRGRAKQSAGSGGLLVALMVGGGLLLALLAVGGAAAWWWLSTDDNSMTPAVEAPPVQPPSPVADLELVPADAPAFATVALAGWWNGPHGKRFRQHFAQWDVAGEIEKILGVRPEQAQRITAVLSARSGEPAFIVSTTEPYQRSRVLGHLAPGGQPRQVGNKSLVVNTRRSGVHFASDRTYVFGRERSLGEFLSAPSPAGGKEGGPLQTALALADEHLVVVGVNAEFQGLQQMRENLARRKGPGQAELARALEPLRDAKVAHLTLDVTEELAIDLKLTYTDTVAAANGLTSAKATLDLARTLLGEGRKQVPRQWSQAVAPAFNFVDALLRTTVSQQQGDAVRLHVQTEKGEVEQYTMALVPAVQKVRETATRMTSANNLKQMVLAMHNYAATRRGQLPTSAIYSPQGQPLLSWRVALLPFLEQQNLYQQFRLNEPWDSPHNKRLLPLMPKVYAPVVRGPDDPPYSTPYRVFTGPQTPFPGRTPTQLFRFTDGTSNTILIVEAKETVPWTKPDELVYDPNQSLPKLGGMFPGGFNIAQADGAVRFLPRSLSEKTLRAAITPSGGEILGKDWR